MTGLTFHFFEEFASGGGAPELAVDSQSAGRDHAKGEAENRQQRPREGVIVRDMVRICIRGEANGGGGGCVNN